MMTKPRRILVPTDFSKASRTALHRAATLAVAYDAELHLLHVMWSGADDPYSLAWIEDSRQELEERLEATLRDELRQMLADLDAEDSRLASHLRHGPAPAPMIVDFAASRDIDLIVMGAHGKRGWRRLLLGSVTEEVVRTAPCNVLCLHEEPREGQGILHRILVPVDFSEPSRTALEVARSMATGPRTILDLVHVIEHPVVPQYFDPFEARIPATTMAEVSARVEKQLALLADDVAGPDVDCRIEILEGPVARRVVEHAEKTDSDLIVLSTHGHTGFQHLMLGSVAERIVRLAERPVLVVRQPPNESR